LQALGSMGSGVLFGYESYRLDQWRQFHGMLTAHNTVPYMIAEDA